MGKSTISMAMFNSYVAIYQRVHQQTVHWGGTPHFAIDGWPAAADCNVDGQCKRFEPVGLQ